MECKKERTSLVFKELEVLLQDKKPAKKPVVKDQGFGFYYPNAVAVSRKKLQLIGREMEPGFHH